MARIIMKSPYLKPNGKAGKHAGNYVRYIATREGVAMAEDTEKHLPASRKQEALLKQILKDFPDSIDLHEYTDFQQNPTRENASELIDRVLETHSGELGNREKYVSYIAERPGVEKLGKHGLFTDEGVPIVLDQVAREMAESKSNIWTHIISLRREDATRLGYETAEDWMNLLRSKRNVIAREMGIKPENFRWYAAFHIAGHHPHVHVMAYSIDPKEAYLSKKGIENIKQELAKEIFRQDQISIYQKQTEYRDQLRNQGRKSISDIVSQINAGTYQNPTVEALLIDLSDRLSRTSGKKVYGYLKADVKAIVDQIVRELAGDENIRKLYNLWYDQREEVLRTYTDTFPERVPLEQNKEFKSIRNAVIQEAMKIVTGIRGAADLEPRQDTVEIGLPTGEEASTEYRLGAMNLTGTGTEVDLEQARFYFEKAVELGNGDALYGLGRLYLKPEYSDYDPAKAIAYLEQAVAKDNAFAKYQLGKLLCQGEIVEKDIAKGLPLLEELAQNGVTFAAYIAGKVYLKEEGWQDIKKAIHYFQQAAEDGNSYGEYQLGKLYYFGNGVRADQERGLEYLKASAAHGNQYAANLLQVIQHQQTWGAAQGVASLIAQLGRMFQEQEQKQNQQQEQKMDRKQQREIDEKKQAMGIRD